VTGPVKYKVKIKTDKVSLSPEQSEVHRSEKIFEWRLKSGDDNVKKRCKIEVLVQGSLERKN